MVAIVTPSRRLWTPGQYLDPWELISSRLLHRDSATGAVIRDELTGAINRGNNCCNCGPPPPPPPGGCCDEPGECCYTGDQDIEVFVQARGEYVWTSIRDSTPTGGILSQEDFFSEFDASFTKTDFVTANECNVGFGAFDDVLGTFTWRRVDETTPVPSICEVAGTITFRVNAGVGSPNAECQSQLVVGISALSITPQTVVEASGDFNATQCINAVPLSPAGLPDSLNGDMISERAARKEVFPVQACLASGGQNIGGGYTGSGSQLITSGSIIGDVFWNATGVYQC